MGTPSPDPLVVDPVVQASLLRWSDDHLRDLPWRHTRDPWAVHVSEVMLQQTQVDRVIPRWGEFLADYPDVEACAHAPVSAIITRWVGLGFNRRAVLLHRAASHIADALGGRYPRTIEELEALPGIGSYTARAIMAFAFEADVGVLDTNVGRVLARLANRALSPREAQAYADALVPAGGGWRWNQTMFDLGATVCRRRAPRCEQCPVAERCGWFATGSRAPDPADASAGTSKAQSRFEGSDRQGRGRLIAALAQTEAVPLSAAAEAMGWAGDPERSQRVLGGLIAEGLVVIDGDAEVVRLVSESSTTPRR